MVKKNGGLVTAQTLSSRGWVAADIASYYKKANDGDVLLHKVRNNWPFIFGLRHDDVISLKPRINDHITSSRPVLCQKEGQAFCSVSYFLAKRSVMRLSRVEVEQHNELQISAAIIRYFMQQ